MILLKVVKAKHLDHYKLELLFNEGVKGITDLKDKDFTDHRSVFKRPQNVEFFKKFKQNRWTIEWDNGVDLAPEFLHKLVLKDYDSQRQHQ